MTLYDFIIPAFLALLSAALSVVWTKSDRAEKISETNKMFLNQLIKNLDKTAQLNERLTSLEATVHIEIKNISIAIKRMESALLRINQNDQNRPR